MRYLKWALMLWREWRKLRRIFKITRAAKRIEYVVIPRTVMDGITRDFQNIADHSTDPEAVRALARSGVFIVSLHYSGKDD